MASVFCSRKGTATIGDEEILGGGERRESPRRDRRGAVGKAPRWGGEGGLGTDFGAGVGGEGGGEIAFARGAGDGDDEFAFIFGAFGDFDGGADIGAGADPDEEAFLFGEASSHGEGVVVGDLNALGDLIGTLGIFEVEIIGDEACACALDFVWPWFKGLASKGLRDDGRVFGFDGDGLEGGFAGEEGFDAAGDGATGTDGGDEDIDLAIGIVPEFFGGGLGMDGGVSGVIELLGHPAVWGIFDEIFGAGDGAFHAFGAWGEDEFCAEHGEERAALEGHGFGHGEDEFVSFGGGDEGEGDAGVSAGGLDDHAVFGEDATGFGVFDHGFADAIFDGAEGIKELAL